MGLGTAAMVLVVLLCGGPGLATKDTPYHAPQLIAEEPIAAIPDHFEDDTLKPPQFLVDAKQRREKFLEDTRAALSEQNLRPLPHHHHQNDVLGADLGASNKHTDSSLEHKLGDLEKKTATEQREWGANGVPGKGVPIVGPSIESVHRDEEPPRKGCGDRKHEMPCHDDAAPGDGVTYKDGSVSPGGEPRHMVASWDVYPTLPTSYTTPHAEYFKKEDECMPDEASASFDKLDQQLEVELQRQMDGKTNHREHSCVGLVKNIEIQYNELKIKVETRRRTMTRNNALPFVQEEKTPNMGPHRRLLASLLQEDSDEITSGSGSGAGSGSMATTNAGNPPPMVLKTDGDLDLARSPFDGKAIPGRGPQLAPYDYETSGPKSLKSLGGLDKAEEEVEGMVGAENAELSQLQRCIKQVDEMVPILKVLKAQSTQDIQPIMSPAAEKAFLLGKEPKPEPGSSGSSGG